MVGLHQARLGVVRRNAHLQKDIMQEPHIANLFITFLIIKSPGGELEPEPCRKPL